MESVRALPPSAQIEAVKGITAAGNALDRAGNAVRSWAHGNPNTAEGIKAAANVGGAAFGAVRGISHVRSNYEFGGIAVTRSQMGAVGTFGKKNLNTTVTKNIAFPRESDAKAAAQKLGYFKINERTNKGAAIYKKGSSYISRDMDGHNGGVWKEASSPSKLNNKTTRNGTFDKNLKRIGD